MKPLNQSVSAYIRTWAKQSLTKAATYVTEDYILIVDTPGWKSTIENSEVHIKFHEMMLVGNSHLPFTFYTHSMPSFLGYIHKHDRACAFPGTVK
jgi:hypothetical protein